MEPPHNPHLSQDGPGTPTSVAYFRISAASCVRNETALNHGEKISGFSRPFWSVKSAISICVVRNKSSELTSAFKHISGGMGTGFELFAHLRSKKRRFGEIGPEYVRYSERTKRLIPGICRRGLLRSDTFIGCIDRGSHFIDC
jgi:hypothetical protein